MASGSSGKTCGTCSKTTNNCNAGCSCPDTSGPDYTTKRCVGTPKGISKARRPIKSRSKRQSNYNGPYPPPYEILPKFVYNCDNSYLGAKLEESNWNPLDLFRNKCKSACSGHQKNSAEWHGCMDICKFEEDRRTNGNGGGGWWKDTFGKPSVEDCAGKCRDGGCIIRNDCQQCEDTCTSGRSPARQYIESEGGLFSLLDKLGSTIGKLKGWGTGSNVAGPWQPRPEEDKNEKLIWGAIILIFLIGIIAFVYFMGKKK